MDYGMHEKMRGLLQSIMENEKSIDLNAMDKETIRVLKHCIDVKYVTGAVFKLNANGEYVGQRTSSSLEVTDDGKRFLNF